MLTVNHLTVGYGDRIILHNVSFSLADGFYVLLGQNGAGKTTLFRTLSGTVRPQSGTVSLDGENLLSLPPKQLARRLSLVLGTHQTLSGITGQDLAEMAFYPSHGLFYRIGQSERERILRTAREFGAETLLSRPLDRMSAGERQLTELVAAVCQNTPLLLLDEPTSALDYNRTHDFLTKAKSLAEKKILLATLHDPGLALTYADRILMLQDGKIVGDFVPADTDAAEAETVLRLLYPRLRVTETENKLTVI